MIIKNCFLNEIIEYTLIPLAKLKMETAFAFTFIGNTNRTKGFIYEILFCSKYVRCHELATLTVTHILNSAIPPVHVTVLCLMIQSADIFLGTYPTKLMSCPFTCHNSKRSWQQLGMSLSCFYFYLLFFLAIHFSNQLCSILKFLIQVGLLNNDIMHNQLQLNCIQTSYNYSYTDHQLAIQFYTANPLVTDTT